MKPMFFIPPVLAKNYLANTTDTADTQKPGKKSKKASIVCHKQLANTAEKAVM